MKKSADWAKYRRPKLKTLAQLHVCEEHVHNFNECDGCFKLSSEWYAKGIAAGTPTERRTPINCKHPDPKPLVIGTPFSVHLAWALWCILVGVLCFAWGYGPSWSGFYQAPPMEGR